MHSTYEEKEILLRVRISKEIQDAYDLVRDHYELTQSDVVRMAPLLLTLLAEGSLIKDFEVFKKGLEKEIKDKRKVETFLERVRRPFTRKIFTDYLKDLAKKQAKEQKNQDSRRPIDPDHITPGSDALPKYKIFQETLNRIDLIGEEKLLRSVAGEIAKNVTDAKEEKIPEDPNLGVIPETYWVRLMITARNALDISSLNSEQQKIIRQAFCDAAYKKNTTERALQEAAQRVAKEAREQGITIQHEFEFIPPEYDGRLLSYARAMLGKYLTAKEKEEVRKLLKKQLIQGYP